MTHESRIHVENGDIVLKIADNFPLKVNFFLQMFNVSGTDFIQFELGRWIITGLKYVVEPSLELDQTHSHIRSQFTRTNILFDLFIVFINNYKMVYLNSFQSYYLKNHIHKILGIKFIDS